MIVLDASAVVELLLVTEAGRTVAQRISDPVESLHAPHLLSVEVAQVLHRLHRSGDLSAARARQALEDLADLGIEHYSHEPFLDRMWAPQLSHESRNLEWTPPSRVRPGLAALVDEPERPRHP